MKIRTSKMLKGEIHLPTEFREVWVSGENGERTYGHIHRPRKPGRYPAIMLVPGGEGSGNDFDKEDRFRADDVAALGFIVMHYDPQGRGKSGGKEDYWGQMHQEELHRLLKYLSALPDTDENRIGVVSTSIGVVIAAGALSRHPNDPKVNFLFDWEGPSNKNNITLNGTHPPLMKFPLSDDAFWSPRQASEYIGNIRCGYFRYQGEEDHVQGEFKGHAFELLNIATNGQAAWTRCNDNPPDIIYDSKQGEKYSWVPKKTNQAAAMLHYLIEISGNNRG